MVKLTIDRQAAKGWREGILGEGLPAIRPTESPGPAARQRCRPLSCTFQHAVVPMELSIDTAATVRVTSGTIAGPDFPVWIVAYSALGLGPVFNQDWTINSQTNPAKLGSWVAFYATGWQSNFAPLADGQVATVAQDACLGNCGASAMTTPLPFSSTYLLPATVLYGGDAPDMVAGVTQFNVQLGTLLNYCCSGWPIYRFPGSMEPDAPVDFLRFYAAFLDWRRVSGYRCSAAASNSCARGLSGCSARTFLTAVAARILCPSDAPMLPACAKQRASPISAVEKLNLACTSDGCFAMAALADSAAGKKRRIATS
jgi:hypothetical protein